MYQVNLNATTIQLLEGRRLSKEESIDQILQRILSPTPKSPAPTAPEKSFNLGKGVWLSEGEEMFMFRAKASRDQQKPEAVAKVVDGKLMLFDQPVMMSKGSYVQPALRRVQIALQDKNPYGEYISLDAWSYWYVARNGKLVTVGELRDPDQITRRRKPLKLDLDLSALDP